MPIYLAYQSVNGCERGKGGVPVRRRLALVDVTLACFLLLFVAALTACQRPPPEHHETLFVFGTLVEFTVLGVAPEKAAAAIRQVDERFQRMHREWHAWKPGGALVSLNAALANGETTTVDDFLLPLLEQSKRLYAQSDGLFNPAIGALIDLWGFHSDELPPGPPPQQEQIQALLDQHPGMDDLKIDGTQVSSATRVVQLDLGGFAKGYAMNDAITTLRAQGIENAIVNAGGDLCVAGRHDDRPWRIGVRHPQGWGVLAAIEVADGECVLTSGNYERYREHEGKRYAHILDPRTGWPVDHVASATVIHIDGGIADAAATALTVAGPADWQRIARQMGLEYVMLVDETGTVYMSPAMAGRVEFEGTIPERVVVGDGL
ncbi:MAG: FAD:protein FMN transferase [Thiogranum sp.]|nr:FAD:protein FMN transferase [Thiogranum sp.]